MCKVFKVSRSGYYQWQVREPSKRQMENEEIAAEIDRIYRESRQRYGSPKITDELSDLGWKVSRPRVARIMRYKGLRSIITRKFRGATTDSAHHFPVAPNLLNRDFKATEAGRKWVSDITYIATRQGWMYLTIIMDLFDRKIVGWSSGTSLATEDTILPAWRMATKNRPVDARLTFHSDQGVQYASNTFTRVLRNNSVTQSMSRKGNCWDNAVAENFFKILKSEMVKHTSFQGILHAKTELFEFIEIWYNRRRKHAYLGYKSPEQFANIQQLKCA